jgi:hypothetical protein
VVLGKEWNTTMRAILADIPVSIRTPFNQRHNPAKIERRILRNGRWVRKDPMAANVLTWLRASLPEPQPVRL